MVLTILLTISVVKGVAIFNALTEVWTLRESPYTSI